MNDRVAAECLRGKVQSAQFVPGEARQILGFPFLFDRPGGRRQRQLLWGDDFRVYEHCAGGWYFGQSQKDGYVGYINARTTEPQKLTHQINKPITWLFHDQDFKRPPIQCLYLNARVSVVETQGNWSAVHIGKSICETSVAWVPAGHIRAINSPVVEYVEVAESLLNAPYLWAGNTAQGLDCSGLVQLSLHAAGKNCAADSDLQQQEGKEVSDRKDVRRGDLLFWSGHVAMAINRDNIVHANAFHMAVAYENTDHAIQRIKRQGDGDLTAIRRP